MSHLGPHRPRARRGVAFMTIIVALLGLVAIAGGALMLGRGSGSGAGMPDLQRFTARVGDFEVSVPASGELIAAKQTEIASQVDGRAAITYIIDEGATVEAGDILIKLDDSEVRDEIEEALLDVDNAETALASARSSLELARRSKESELAIANTDVELAELALEAWRSGEDVSRRKQLELELETAKKDFARLEARYLASIDLLDREFISKDEFDRDEIEMIRARSRLEQAELALKVYGEYEAVQQREQLNSDIRRARDAREDMIKRKDTEITAQEREVRNREFNLERQREDLAEAERQLELCTIIAPQGGLVVYASSLDRGRRGDDDRPEVGTELRRNRTVILLPDTSRMLAEVKVNEAISGRINPGQEVYVVSDALPETPLTGIVEGVGVLAESGGWRDPNRRDYTVRIALQDTAGLGLKPSMRCKAEIRVDVVEEALHVPVTAIFRDGADAFVYVPDGSGFRRRTVRIGRTSELFVEVVDGLEEGEQVLLVEPAEDLIRSDESTA